MIKFFQIVPIPLVLQGYALFIPKLDFAFRGQIRYDKKMVASKTKRIWRTST